MSIVSVMKEIQKAMKTGPNPPMGGSLIDGCEADRIVKEAEKGPLTVGEKKAIADLFDRAARQPRPGDMVTLAIPETPASVPVLDAQSQRVFDLFFVRHNVPAGSKKAEYVARIESSLDNSGWGTKLEQAPDVSKLFRVDLPYPEGAADFPGRTAFVDVKKGEFYLKVSGGLMAPNAANTHWFGPNKLDELAFTQALGEGPASVDTDA